MQRRILILAFAAGLGMPLLAQNETFVEKANPLSSDRGGFRLQNVSAFTTYYSIAPEGIYATSVSGILRGDVAAGGSATLGYTSFGERSGIALSYTASYTQSLRFSADAINHALSLSWRRNLRPKWSFNFAVSAAAASISDSLFMGTAMANLVAVPASFDDFAAALVGGRFTNNQLAAVLNGAPIIESATGLLLYGSRSLTAAVRSGITYSRSSRLKFYVEGSANRSQPLRDSGLPPGVRPVYVIAHTTGAAAAVGMGYALSPRTQITVDGAASRIFSDFQDSYTSSANVGLARTMGMNWFLRVHGGTGITTYVRQTRSQPALPSGVQYEGGGSIGYKTRSSTFMGGVERTISDSYGYGASTSLAATGAWNWRRPSSSWWVSANFVQQWLNGGILIPNIDIWRATAEFGRQVGRHVTISTQYAYLSDITLIGNGLQGGQHMVRVSMNWSPGVRRAVQ